MTHSVWGNIYQALRVNHYLTFFFFSGSNPFCQDVNSTLNLLNLSEPASQYNLELYSRSRSSLNSRDKVSKDTNSEKAVPCSHRWHLQIIYWTPEEIQFPLKKKKKKKKDRKLC